MITMELQVLDIGKTKSRNEGVVKIKGYYGNPNCRLIEHIFKK